MNNIYKKIMALSLVSITVIGCIPSKVTDSETSSSNSFTYSDFESFYNDNESLFISDSTISDDLSFIESDYLSSNQDSFTNNSNDVDSSVFSDNVSDSTISDSSINNSSEDNKRYTVTFTFKDEIVDTIEVECNDILTNLPTLEQKNGYENVVWDYDNTPITSDITIEAKYDLIQYNIYYNIEYGENNTLNVLTYNIESDDITLYAPVNIEEIGKSFVGWFTSSDFKNDSFVNSIKTGSYGDITLYAKFDTCVVEEVKGFTIDYSTSDHPSIKGEVDDTCDSISFLDIVKVSNNCKFKIYSDEDCTNEIDDKTISLSSGHNYFYLVVSCGNDISLKYIIDVNKKEKETIIGDENEFEYQGVKYKLDNDVYKVVGYTDNIESEVTIVSQYNDKMVTCIDESAFSNCSSLTSIKIPSSVTSIGEWAFAGCSSLTTVIFEENSQLESIGDYAFYDCSKLTSIEIPSSVTTIGYRAFAGCSSLTTVIFEENSQLESIGNNAFYDCSKLTSIIIPSSVTTIGYSAFSGCNSLTSITLPSSVTTIGYRAFSGCDSLQYNEYDNGLYLGNNENPYLVLVKTKDTSITSCIINENARFIYSYAFYNCSKLTSIIIPSSVTSIGYSAFSGCSSLANVFYEGTIEDWCNITFSNEYSNPMCYASHFYMLDENNNYKEVTSIEIPSTVTSICKYQFFGFNNVTSITIPSSVTSIGSYAFSGCDSLQYNEYDNGLYLGNNENPYLVLVKTKDTSITSCIINENARFIYSYAFYNCSKLTSIKIPSSVTTIGYSAFSGCSSLTNVYYNGTIEDWCRIIFDGWGSNPMTYALHFYMLDENNNYKEVTSIEIPSTITSIGDYQFYGFNNVTSIKIPSSVTTIGEWAFEDCSSLANVFYSGTIEDWCNITFDEFISNPMSKASHFYMLDENNNYKEVTSIEIPSTITSIGDYQFYGFNNVTSIKIPSSVTTIGYSAFAGCSSLTTVIFEENSQLESIGDYAFYDCSKLTSIEIPSSVTTIGYRAFSGCDSLQYNEYDNGLYLGNNENPYLVLVKTKDTSITSCIINENARFIYSYAFYDCSKLTSIIIPSSVTSIGEWAFAGCNSLTSITLPSSVTTIGYSAFAGCNSLTSITLPSSVTTIGYSAFAGCNSLTSITLPSSVTTIGYRAFFGCSSLTNVYYSGTIEDWCNITFSNEYSNPMCYASHFYMLDENNNYKEVTSIEIPSTITSIGDYQFYGFNNVTSIKIPSSVTTIGEGAFSGCTSLKTITLPFIGGSKDSNKYLGYIFGASSYTSNSSYVPSSLKEVIILNGYTSIDSYAFYYCKYLTSITIPSSVTTIGYSAFFGCSSLTNVYYSGTIEDWCNITFSNEYSNPMCYASHFYMLDENNNYKEVTSIEIPSTITSIGDYQFYGFNNVTSIKIPSSVTTIGYSAFAGCSSLTTVIFEENSQLESIGDYAFYDCSKLTSIEIPSSVTTIGYSAFSGCNSLTSITLPSSVTSIGEWAFAGCDSLTSITLPSSVTSIGEWAFAGCDSLQYNEYDNGLYLGNNENPYLVLVKTKDTSITSCIINENARFIYSYAFYNCSKLTTVIFEENSQLESIGDYAFYDCSKLTSIIIPSSVTTIGEGAFSGCNSLTSITLPSSVTSIGEWAFAGCDSLTSITLPSSVTSIGEWAFAGCDSLQYNEYDNGLYLGNNENPYLVLVKTKDTSITSCIINENARFIYSYAFYNCSKLTTVIFEENSQLESIGDYAFYDCSKLTSIIIPSSVTTIGYSAFSGCDSLTSITLPSSVTTIGYSAFSGCNSLTIYCEVSSKPSGWDSYWNSSNCPVVWGYTIE